MGKARLQITGELLRNMLFLPGDVVFQGAKITDYARGDGFDIELIVKSETLPEVKDDERIPLVVARLRQEEVGFGEVWQTHFDGWQ